MNSDYHDQRLTIEQLRNLNPEQLRRLVSNVNQNAAEVADIRKQQMKALTDKQMTQESKS